ncbi:di-trans,poly-cis-decaprenylcistransferase [Candidatus Woesearchaeota archaeon]|nr:di-trans,poly-cis-decaprenylcistransferase [Candidatus Woesearchaeota archaeon]
MPSHIAIILDGNRRYAKKAGINPLEGHTHGAKKAGELLGWMRELGIKQATLYVLSTENLKRTPIEVKTLMDIFRHYLSDALKDERITENKARIRFVGQLELLPPDILQGMAELMDKTKRFSDFKINFAIAYGGKAEIANAARILAEKAKAGTISPADIDESLFSSHLYIQDEPDLMIRPGGEKRLSNFLLWQLAYSELIFLDKLWPEITKQDIIDCIAEFDRRERRIGK